MEGPIVYLNGLFTPLENAKISILDRGFCYGDGLFETMRASNGKVFRLDQHIDRLFKSLPFLFLDLPMTKVEVRDAVLDTCIRNGYKKAIIRLTLTRGANTSGFQIDPDACPTLVVHARPHNPLPRAVYKNGIQISLLVMRTSSLPGVKQSLKSCNFLSNILVREISLRKGSMEGIVIDPDFGVTEGATSNLFIVKQGILKTPDINSSVLEGITRRVVLEIASNHKIPVEEGSIYIEDILTADEVFITNSGIDIVPVTRVDETIVGNRKPGALTCFLQKEFLKFVEESH